MAPKSLRFHEMLLDSSAAFVHIIMSFKYIYYSRTSTMNIYFTPYFMDYFIMWNNMQLLV